MANFEIVQRTSQSEKRFLKMEFNNFNRVLSESTFLTVGKCYTVTNGRSHGLWTPGEEITFTAQPNIHSHSQIFRYDQSIFTPSNSEIICVQNVGAKVEMVSYLKKQIKIKILKRKKNPGSPLEVTC